MKPYLFFLMCFITLFPFDSRSQSMISDQMNHNKYWYYRYRLTRNYICLSQSNTKGRNIPASIRGMWGGELKWGDATIDLGWYIGVLATEYKLLKDNQQSTTSVLDELCFAIDCFNRLDYYAETYYNDPSTGLPGSPNLNGFFVRDDVDPSVLYPGLMTGYHSNVTVDHIASDYQDAVSQSKNITAGGNDQLWHLMMGFRLVKAYVPPNVTWPIAGRQFMDGETRVLKAVQNIVDRVFHHLSIHNWFFYNTVLNENVPNNQGGGVQVFSFGAAVVADIISPPADALYGNHQDPYSLTTGATVWSTMAGTGGWFGETCESNGNNYKFLIVAALGNSWNSTIVASRAALDHFEHIPLLQELLYGTTNPIQDPAYINLFNEAPCEGPYQFANHVYPSNEWSARQRFVHPLSRHSELCDHILSFPGEYNGLDYMLFHNVWYIAHGGYSAFSLIVNSNPSLKTFPTPTGLGSVSNPYITNGYDQIYASGMTVTANASVHLRGNVVHLVANTSIKPSGSGSIFTAKPSSFTCTSAVGDYSLVESTTASTASTSMSLDEQVPVNTVVLNNPYVQEYKNALEKNSGNHPASQLQSEVTLGPNPTDGHFNIQLAVDGVRKISIHNVMGHSVWELNTPSDKLVQADLSSSPEGVYYVHIVKQDGSLLIKKLIRH